MSKKMDPKSPLPQRLSDGRASTTPSKLRKSCMSMRIFTPNSLDNNGFDVDSPVGAPRKKTITIDPNAKSAEIPRVVRSNLNKFTKRLFTLGKSCSCTLGSRNFQFCD